MCKEYPVRCNSIAFRNKADALSLIRIGKEEPLSGKEPPSCRANYLRLSSSSMQPEGMTWALAATHNMSTCLFNMHRYLAWQAETPRICPKHLQGLAPSGSCRRQEIQSSILSPLRLQAVSGSNASAGNKDYKDCFCCQKLRPTIQPNWREMPTADVLLSVQDDSQAAESRGNPPQYGQQASATWG